MNGDIHAQQTGPPAVQVVKGAGLRVHPCSPVIANASVCVNLPCTGNTNSRSAGRKQSFKSRIQA